MPEYACPGCQAEIEPDLVERTGNAICPFCGAELSSLGLALPHAESRPAVDSPGGGFESGSITRPLPPVPAGSTIKIVESTPERLVLFIPGGGGRASGLGCFGLVWNLFVVVFSAVFLGTILFDKGGDAPPVLPVVGILSLFWLIGIGFIFFWIKFRFERTFLLLDPGRIVVQRVLFNRKRLSETILDAESRAELVESYRQNEKPVYRVEVRGTPASAKFGTALSDEEKDWLVDRINEFLGVRAGQGAENSAAVKGGAIAAAALISDAGQSSLVFPNACEKCAAPLPGLPVDGILTCEHCGAPHRGQLVAVDIRPESAPPEVYDRLTPDHLPPGSGIHVIEATRDRLRLWFSAFAEGSAFRWIVPAMTIPFAIVWYVLLLGFIVVLLKAPIGFFVILPLLFMVPFVLAGLMPLGMGLFALRGRTTVDLTRESLTCRWSVGRFGYSRSLPTPLIDGLRLESSENSRVRNERAVGRNTVRVGGDTKACVVRAGGKALYPTLFQEESFSRQVVSLLRTQLADMGHPLRDV
jgi:hypothetical protein